MDAGRFIERRFELAQIPAGLIQPRRLRCCLGRIRSIDLKDTCHWHISGIAQPPPNRFVAACPSFSLSQPRVHCISPCPSSQFFSIGFNTFPCELVSIECVRSPLKKILKGKRCHATGPDRPGVLKDQPLLERTPGRDRDACRQSTLGGFVSPWNRSFSMETYLQDEQL
jgi:hypothetical protein